MKKIIYFTCVGCVVFLISCTRSAVDKDASKIVFQIPTFEATSRQALKTYTFVNTLLSTSAIRSMASSQLPTGLTGATPINCFAVMVSGPEETLRRNHCKKTSSSAPIVDFDFGDLSPAATFGGNIEMEVTSGAGRSFRLLGMHSTTGSCVGFKDNDKDFSKPYIVSESLNNLLEPGTTKVIPMTMTYSADNYIDECTGPDFPNGGDGGGSSGEAAKLLAVRKDFFPENRVPEATCQSIDVVSYSSETNQRLVGQPVEFRLKIHGVVVPIFSGYNECMNNQSLATAVMPAQTDRKNVWFHAPTRSQGLSAQFDIEFVSNPQSLSSVPLQVSVEEVTSLTFEVIAPMQILPNVCYAAGAEAKWMTGALYYLSEMVNVEGRNGLTIYSDATCSTAASTVQFWSGRSVVYYFKIDGSLPNPQIAFTRSGYVDGVKTLKIGSGSMNVTQFEVMYSRNVRMNYCSDAIITFYNENHTVVPLPTSLTMAFSGADTVVYPGGDCMTATASEVFPAGTTSRRISIRSSAYGQKQIAFSAGGLPTFTASFFSDYNTQTMASFTGGGGDVAAGSCLEVQLGLMDLAYGSPTNLASSQVVSVTSSLPLYASSSCTGTPLASLIFPSGVLNIKTYVLADNNTMVASAATLQFQVPNTLPAQLSVNIFARPVFQRQWDSSTMKLPPGSLDMNLFSTPFTGSGPYSYLKNSGTGTLTGSTYVTVGGDSAYITATDGRGTTLNYNTQTFAPDYDYNFMTGTLPSGFSINRSGAAYYYDGAGTLVSASSNTPRFDHNPDPSSSYAYEGLLIEPARTNQVIYSNDMTMWSGYQAATMSVASVTNPMGTSLSYAVAVTAIDNANMPLLRTNSFTPTAYQTYTASVYVKKLDSRYVGMKIHEDAYPYHGYSGVVIDLDTGNVVGMMDPWAGDVSVNFGVHKLKNGWFRIWTNYKAKGGNALSMYIYPSYQNGPLSPHRDYSPPIAKTYFWGAQIEEGDSLTSIIPTTAGIVQRPADGVTLSIANFASLQGAPERSIYFEYSKPEGNREESGYLFMLCGTSCAQESVSARYAANGGFQSTLVANSGVQYVPLYSVPMSVRPKINKVAQSLTGNTNYAYNYSINGAAGSTDATPNIVNPNIASGGMLYVAMDEGGIYRSTMHLRRIQLWSQRLSLPGLRNLTRP